MTLTAIDLATGFAVGMAAVLVAVVVYLLLRRLRGQNPTLDIVLDALKPYALKAIFAAETLALRAFTETHEALEGVDKKRLADSLYAALPGTIWIGPQAVPVGWVKTFVSRERWSQLVQDVFDEVQAEVLKQQTYLREQVAALTDIDVSLRA